MVAWISDFLFHKEASRYGIETSAKEGQFSIE
jgi:hypothetical protein